MRYVSGVHIDEILYWLKLWRKINIEYRGWSSRLCSRPISSKPDQTIWGLAKNFSPQLRLGLGFTSEYWTGIDQYITAPLFQLLDLTSLYLLHFTLPTPLHFTFRLHFHSLNTITFHSTPLHFTPHSTPHSIHIPPHCTALHIPLLSTALHFTPLYIPVHFTPLHMPLHIPAHSTSLHCTPHSTPFHCIALPFTLSHLEWRSCAVSGWPCIPGSPRLACLCSAESTAGTGTRTWKD